MKAIDFLYGERTLSSFGCMICQFGGSKGLDVVSNGAEVTFNTISTLNGQKYELTSTQYENCLEATIQICKCSCSSDIQEITPVEFRELTKWLNRRKFLKFKLLEESYIDLYYEVSFNISRIEIDGRLYGLELQAVTNKPFALKEPKTITIKNTVQNGKYSINDESYEEGYIYPYMEIAITQNGDLSIYNAMENRNTIIKNVSAGETIIMNYPIIQSSLPSHNIQNDFNWKFFRIANTYDNSRNDLTISLPCTIKVRYSPIVKVGL